MKPEDWKFERMRKKIILEEIASYCHCSISYINKWENGHTGLSDDVLRRYKEFINNK